MPKRIQRRRTKGWRMPDGAVYVGRPTKWGNPFRVGGYYKIGSGGWLWCQSFVGPEGGFTLLTSVEQCIEWYCRLASYTPRKFDDLRGKDLCCWCPLDQPCHVDVLLEFANS